jgi:hypothetical protein
MTPEQYQKWLSETLGDCPHGMPAAAYCGECIREKQAAEREERDRKALDQRKDELIGNQAQVVENQSAEITRLRRINDLLERRRTQGERRERRFLGRRGR